jgi:hypothetical protein
MAPAHKAREAAATAARGDGTPERERPAPSARITTATAIASLDDERWVGGLPGRIADEQEPDTAFTQNPPT